MHHLDHSHAHRPAADDHHGRRAELEEIVVAYQSEGFAPPSYAVQGLATLDALLGPGEDLTD